jgi:hypothetical protein
MSFGRSLLDAVVKAIKWIPMFLVLALASCFAGHYVLEIPFNFLAVVVAVPCVWLYILMKVLRIFVDRIPIPTPLPPPPRFSLFVFGGCAFCFGLASIDLLFSAPVFSRLGILDISLVAYKVAAFFGMMSFVGFSFIFVRLATPADPFRSFSAHVTLRIQHLLALPVHLVNGFSNLPKYQNTRW